jgi:serine phosphatase RsbU (regulator of sigma subunit)
VLGAWRGARYAIEQVQLEPGDLLLLYTDGLVERPDLSVDTGVEQLATTMAAAADPTVADGNPMMAVLHAVRRANPADDTCVVVAEAVGV